MTLVTQSPQGVEIPDVQRIRRDEVWLVAVGRLLRFDQHWQACKPTVPQQPAKGIEAQAALTDVLVPVHAATTWPLRIIRMKHAKPIDANELLEGVERVFVASARRQVVAGGDQVTGVEANARARRSIELVDDRRELFEAVSDRATLACGVLEEHHRSSPRPRAKCSADRLGNQSQRIFFSANRARPRMDDDTQ